MADSPNAENHRSMPEMQEAEQFRLLVNSTTDYAIFLLDPQGHIATWNPGAERIKGYKEHEIIGHHFSKFYPPKPVRVIGPHTNCRWPLRRDDLKTKAGACAKMVRSFGPTL